MRKSERDIEEARTMLGAFFLENPHRQYHTRKALPGEAENPRHDYIVSKWGGFDGKYVETEVLDIGLEFFPGDDEALGAFLWKRAGDFVTAGSPGTLIISAAEIEAVVAREAAALPGLGAKTWGVDPRRMEATLAYQAARARRAA